MDIAYITVGAIGHVMPTLPFITELVRRGARVRYFTTENMRKTIEFTGAVFMPVDTVLTDGGKAKDDIQVDFMADLPRRFLSEGDCVIRQVLPILQKDRPDIIVSDATAVAGRLAAAALKLPLVQIFTSYVSNEHFSVAAGFPPVPDSHPSRIAARKLAEDFTARYGISHIGLKEIFEWRGDLNIVTLLRKFQPAGDTFDASYHFTGAQIAQRPDHDTWQAPDNDMPIIYASLGTLFNNQPWFFRALFNAVYRLPVHLVCAIGSVMDVSALGEIPQNVSVAPFQPQLEILPKTALFVTHCGTGSVMEALHFGVPMLGVPQIDEQFLTASRMCELGLGLMIADKEDITSMQLRRDIQTILSTPSFSQNARHIQEATRKSGGYMAVADAIVEFADHR